MKHSLDTEAKKLKFLLEHQTTSLSEIIDKIQHNHPQNRILIIADQFEQIYTMIKSDTNLLMLSYKDFTTLQKNPLHPQN